MNWWDWLIIIGLFWLNNSGERSRADRMYKGAWERDETR